MIIETRGVRVRTSAKTQCLSTKDFFKNQIFGGEDPAQLPPLRLLPVTVIITVQIPYEYEYEYEHEHEQGFVDRTSLFFPSIIVVSN